MRSFEREGLFNREWMAVDNKAELLNTEPCKKWENLGFPEVYCKHGQGKRFLVSLTI